jgi:hypothetical protein
MILAAAHAALIAETMLILFLLRSWKTERAELVKMIAAKSYSEYESYNRGGKPPPTDRKSMVDRQQKKMRQNHERGDSG